MTFPRRTTHRERSRKNIFQPIQILSARYTLFVRNKNP